jgi:hypothetical protein
LLTVAEDEEERVAVTVRVADAVADELRVAELVRVGVAVADEDLELVPERVGVADEEGVLDVVPEDDEDLVEEEVLVDVVLVVPVLVPVTVLETEGDPVPVREELGDLVERALLELVSVALADSVEVRDGSEDLLGTPLRDALRVAVLVVVPNNAICARLRFDSWIASRDISTSS